MRTAPLFSLALVVALALIACPAQAKSDLADRAAAQDAVVRLFIATDAKDWDTVEALFTDEVEFDMTSLAGGEPAIMSGAEIAAAWAEGLKDIQEIHHQAGNFLITLGDDEADIFCYATATHYRPERAEPVTTYVGSYDFHLIEEDTAWKIDLFRFNVKYVLNP
jgi:3-phenylpropionate/cinnamic acid dioxygenase small subunit